MQIFDKVKILNDTEYFQKDEEGNIVKVIDDDNAIIYTYRIGYGRVI